LDGNDLDLRPLIVELAREERGGVMPHKKIVWTCSVCGQPVADDEGYLTMEMAEAVRVEEERVTWAENRSEAAAKVDTYPESAHWRVLHIDCDPEPDREAYAFDVRRIRSAWAALAWTAHLMKKPWLAATDWDVLIEQVAANHGGTRA
jgi:hypothetical protein